MNLNIDDREALMEMLESAGYPVLLKLIDDTVYEDFEKKVIQLSMESSSDRELLIRKAKAEGARQFALGITRHLAGLKAKTRK